MMLTIVWSNQIAIFENKGRGHNCNLLFKFATGLVPEKGNLLKLMASNPWLNDPQNITDEDKKRMKVPGEKNLEGPLAMK